MIRDAPGARVVVLCGIASLYRRALGEAVATAPAVRDGAPSTGPAPTYAQVQALVDGPGVTCR
ncbi:hypothetical protein [Streptomyces hebeiensis]|uniref:hypothetical protein n=1 Tax=Streptomyces hebeiensis TaxID=229486 RepID=UPI0031D5ACBB